MPDPDVRAKWDELWTLFGAYFNRDFVDDYGEPDAVIDGFRNENPGEIVRRAADQAEGLARSTEDEESLRKTMLDLGIEYMPWADGWDNSHAWLRHLAEQLRK